MREHEKALRMIFSAALSLERGEENVTECAQDIQRIIIAAIKGENIPEIFSAAKILSMPPVPVGGPRDAG